MHSLENNKQEELEVCTPLQAMILLESWRCSRMVPMLGVLEQQNSGSLGTRDKGDEEGIHPLECMKLHMYIDEEQIKSKE